MSNDKQKSKQLAEKYQFKELNLLNERQLRRKVIEVFNALVASELEVEVLKRKLSNLEQNQSKESKDRKYSGYSSDWGGIEKISFILRVNKKPMLSKEIMDELLMLEPELKQKWKNPFACVARYIYRSLKFKRIERGEKVGEFGYTYYPMERLSNQ